jgi:hypothetical protein
MRLSQSVGKMGCLSPRTTTDYYGLLDLHRGSFAVLAVHRCMRQIDNLYSKNGVDCSVSAAYILKQGCIWEAPITSSSIRCVAGPRPAGSKAVDPERVRHT